MLGGKEEDERAVAWSGGRRQMFPSVEEEDSTQADPYFLLIFYGKRYHLIIFLLCRSYSRRVSPRACGLEPGD